MRSSSLLLATFSAFSFACSGVLSLPDSGSNNNNNPDAGTGGGELTSTMQGDLTVTDVNASADVMEDIWIYMDLETGNQVEPSNPDDSVEWDIAFQRFKVKLNGGISGTGSVEVAQLVNTEFAAVTDAPTAGYITDAADGPDDGEIEDFAISFGVSSETGPWAYDIHDHSLSESTSTWIVKSVESNFYKLRFVDYYNDAGDPGHVTFRWTTVNPPSEEGVIRIELVERGFTYFSVSTAGTLAVSDPDSSTEWDFAIQQAAWATNSGGMRVGSGGAKIADTSDFDAITTVTSTSGFETDVMMMFPGPPGAPMFLLNPVLTDWFIYDSVAHQANPKDLAYVVRLADGSYGKLKILSYDDKSQPYTYRVKLEAL